MKWATWLSGFDGHVARQLQRHDEDSALDDPAGSHVRHVLDQQVVRPDFQIIALVTQPRQVGATTYWFL